MIKTEILKRGFEVGCINRDLESLTKVALDKVKQNLDEEYTDVFVTIRGKLYVVEISTVDNEKDIIFNFAYYGYKRLRENICNTFNG